MTPGSEVKEFYVNDIVYRFDKRKRINFGLVVESYEGSNDLCESHPLTKDQLRIWWFNTSRETIWHQNKVNLASRCVVPGDVVRRLEFGRETQRGYCKESRQHACVQIVGTDKVIERVISDRLLMSSPYEVNVAVCLGKQFGRIQSADQKITMQSKCGSIVEVLTCINSDTIEDSWIAKRDRSYVESCYPGQEVTCVPNNLEQPRWINRSKTMKRGMHVRQHFTVQKVEPSDIEVLWYDNSKGEDTSKNVNITAVKPEDIKNLKIIESVENFHLELAERRLLKLTNLDVLIKKHDWIRKQSALRQHDLHKVVHIVNKNAKRERTPKIRRPSLLPTYNVEDAEEGWWTEEDEEISENGSCSSNSSIPPPPRIRHFPPKTRELVPGQTLAVEILCIESKVTIVWQDGTEERNIPTSQLYYSISLDDHEFFPGEWVMGEDKTDHEYGAIQSVNCLERTAIVKWFTYSDEEKKPKFITSNEKSVYDLRKHEKFTFRPGSIVKYVPEEENKLGSVIDSSPEGYVIVQWLDKSTENCWPQNLELIPDGGDNDYTIDDEESVQLSWETESIESIPGDLADESILQNMATRLDFVRSRVSFLKDTLKKKNSPESFSLLKELLIIYDNSSYLDKLLDTSFFSLKSKHFQVLLSQIKEKAKVNGIELRGRLFTSTDNLSVSTYYPRMKNLEKENINKVLKLQHKINSDAQLAEAGEPSQPLSPEIELPSPPSDNICVELLSMMKVRMDLAYAEIVSRIGGTQALSVMTKAADAQPQPHAAIVNIPMTPDESNAPITFPTEIVNGGTEEVYDLIDEAPSTHHYFDNKVEPTDRMRFTKAIQKEYKLLKENLPPGVWVRAYADRLDLFSVMIRGPCNTPYEDGLFIFDLQFSSDYPRSPPLCYYISYSNERINPNLYVEGRVCISLLGTWMGRGTEVWGPNSTLLQLIVSIQGLILVAEPYYNEAGYEKQMKSQQGYENSRTYNEMVILKLIQSMTEMLQSSPLVFKEEIVRHFTKQGSAICMRIEDWCTDDVRTKPDFPLLPVSRGLKLSLGTALGTFKQALERLTP